MKPNVYHRMRKRSEGIQGKDKEESFQTLLYVLLKAPTTHDQNKNKDLFNNADTITETMSKRRNERQRMKTELQIQF